MDKLRNPLDPEANMQWQQPSQSSTNSSPGLEPMGREMAAKLVRRLLSGYPNLTSPDPERYLAALIKAMEAYPKWAGERAIMRLDENNKSFPPTEKELRSWLEDFVNPTRWAAAWNARSRAQLAARQEEDVAPMCADVRGDGGVGTVYGARVFEQAVAKHGRPRGRFELEKGKTNESLRELLARLSKEGGGLPRGVGRHQDPLKDKE